MTDLDRLAALAGIEPDWTDIFGRRTVVSRETKRALLAAMGIDADDPASAADSLRRIEERTWRRPLPPAVVVSDAGPPTVEVTAWETATGRWTLEEEASGVVHEGAFRAVELPAAEEREVGGVRMVRRSLPLPVLLPSGYHRLTVETGGTTARSVLVVAPDRCLLPDDLEAGRSFWGVAAQLYGLRSDRDWGIGGFRDLAALGAAAADEGAAFVGLSPLHALFPAEPRHISPYSPSSRTFLNVLFIDVADVPGFGEDAEARAVAEDPDVRRRIEAARAEELVDHAAVAALKLPVLRRLHASFRERDLGARETARGRDFRFFLAERGEPLMRQALFDALHAHFYGRDPALWSWRRWPDGFRSPDGDGARRFAGENAREVEFHAWLQWVADRQLAEAQAAARSRGMAIGLYADMAVAEHPDGGSAWALPDVVLTGASVGAPPDAISPQGQDWGLAPWSPVGLAEHAYAPFVEAVRAAMRHAGAIRIDHVMSLTRLFLIPEGRPGTEGAYVRYPLEDLVRILALESRRNRCLVVGEDLGTVPEGFRPRMREAGVLSYRVLWFERSPVDDFLPPAAYPSEALCTVTTHDLPTLRGWWEGRDLAWRAELSVYPDEEARLADGHRRYLDRFRLLDALEREGLLPAGIDRSAGIPDLTPDLVAAIHRYLAASPGRLLAVAAEDLAGEAEQPNLPGTVAEHPNWRRRLGPPVDRLFGLPAARAVCAALREARP
jgi:4-alpha-glucanotransferase